MSAEATRVGTGTPVRTTLQPGDWVVEASSSVARFTVRNFGIRHVHGTFRLTRGVVPVAPDGVPAAVKGSADVTTVATGNRRRDADLCGRRFFDVVRWPEIILVANHVEACDDGWTASAFVVVRGTEAPVTLHVRPVAAMQDGGRRVEATGVLDLRTTPIRAPRALIGRYVEISVECVLRPPSRTA